MNKVNKVETIEQCQELTHESMSANNYNQIGHISVFKLGPYVGKNAKPVPYRRRDYFKISLVIGSISVIYADKVVEVQKQALIFTNPQIPYSWEHTEKITDGLFCAFNQNLFRQYDHPTQYSIYQPNGKHVFELTDDQVQKVKIVFERMFDEMNSEYVHKDDMLRNLVFELMHFVMKMEQTTSFDKHPMNASQRITTLFLELMEQQFPIDESNPIVLYRSASDFAKQLNVSVNHLNKAVKETTQKTTSQIISERILQEAKVLLKHSLWNVSEIAYALAFTEVTHFNNFFKKNAQLNPLKFRND